MTRFFVGITGASGHIYADRLVRALVETGNSVDLCVTSAGAKVLKHELGIDAGPQGRELTRVLPQWFGPEIAAFLRAFPEDMIEAPPSSGTALSGGVILCPCSMGTLARVSVGFSSNLVERVADVALKEGRKLLIVPRESPLSEIHLENMLRMSRLGARILPAMPGFYHRPKSMEDLVGHLVGKLLDSLGVSHSLERWKGTDPEPEPGVERTRG
jgi:4-hydroxy-3-polyprenylbenzoate decarboxylase